jgi:hypothetical protein
MYHKILCRDRQGEKTRVCGFFFTNDPGRIAPARLREPYLAGAIGKQICVTFFLPPGYPWIS